MKKDGAGEKAHDARRVSGTVIFVAAVFALILAPYFGFGGAMEAWAKSLAEPSVGRVAAALALGGLLAGDVVLPVPSSLASTALGYLLGFAGGLTVSWVGMTISALTGYLIGRLGGRPLVTRLATEGSLATLDRLRGPWGDWLVVVTRPVPVLAEAAILFAGTARMPAVQFLVLTAMANLGVSAAYAAVGAFAFRLNSFLLAFAAALVLPGLAMLVSRRRSRHGRRAP